MLLKPLRSVLQLLSLCFLLMPMLVFAKIDAMQLRLLESYQ
ncbi:MAG: hypothetical protein Q9M50_02295 [Methylococcales bacterium]|nr:hypothetical protein [Methylococcales bacterium]